MRSLSRLLLACALAAGALTFAAQSTEADQCWSCWESGSCTICHDSCSGTCVYSCPTGDGYC